MEVKRNKNGPRSWAESMAKSNTLHDFFFCPDWDKKWHEKVKALKKLEQVTPSPTLASIYKTDWTAILENEITPVSTLEQSGTAQ